MTESPFSQEDLVGRDAYVSVSIPRTAWGTVSMEVEGTTQEFRATSSVDIARGEIVRISGVDRQRAHRGAAPRLQRRHRRRPTDAGQDETS